MTNVQYTLHLSEGEVAGEGEGLNSLPGLGPRVGGYLMALGGSTHYRFHTRKITKLISVHTLCLHPI